MKLLLVTAVKSYQKEAAKLLKESGIKAFSHADINGFKSLDERSIQDNWFSGSSENVKSVLFFSFANETDVNGFLNKLDEFNHKLESDNPLKAAVLSIETFR
ncbi:hypothetical protein LCM02_06560 [Lutimonas saemankumensis]|uniref:hypothetical protein n=1 Tax=Lutimonas saemankumensis TaxID=483016 RepID=UPI001CD44A1E|nr:hypothetical protein [Lutimonas saemankumensis]MCA0932106.1 hypothetical protein [Lutimonas saemankumensis]